MFKDKLNMPFCQQTMKHCFPQLSSVVIIGLFTVLSVISIIIGVFSFLSGKKLYYEKQEIILNQEQVINFPVTNNQQEKLNIYLDIPNYFQSTRLYIQSVDYDTAFKSKESYDKEKQHSLLLQSMPKIDMQFKTIDDQSQEQNIQINTQDIIFKDDKTNTAIFSKQFKEEVNNSQQIINWWRTNAYNDVEKLIGQINLSNISNIQNITKYQIYFKAEILLSEKQSTKAYLILASNNLLGSKQSNYSIGIMCFIYAGMSIYMLIYGKKSKQFQN